VCLTVIFVFVDMCLSVCVSVRVCVRVRVCACVPDAIFLILCVSQMLLCVKAYICVSVLVCHVCVLICIDM
jgi:hypothetical protein